MLPIYIVYRDIAFYLNNVAMKEKYYFCQFGPKDKTCPERIKKGLKKYEKSWSHICKKLPACAYYNPE